MKMLLSRIVFGLEVLLFVVAILFNTLLFLASHAFPAGSSWLNFGFFLLSVVSWVLVASLIPYRDTALKDIPKLLVTTAVLSMAYLLFAAFFGGFSLLVGILLFGAIGVLLNIGPILLAVHLLVRAWLIGRKVGAIHP